MGCSLHMGSRPYPLDFSMDDYARISTFTILEAESIKNLVLTCGLIGRHGYVAQAFIDLHPRETAGFVSGDSAPRSQEYSTWEVKRCAIPRGCIAWSWLKVLGSWGVATTAREGRCVPSSRATPRRVWSSPRWLPMLLNLGAAYSIDCPALLLCGEKDHAGDVKCLTVNGLLGRKIFCCGLLERGTNVDNP